MLLRKGIKMEINRNTQKTCSICGEIKSFTQFNNAATPLFKKTLPMCKICSTARLKQYIQQTGDEAAGLWLLLAECGIPFKSDVWKATKDILLRSGVKKPDIFLTYLRIYKEFKIVADSFADSDVELSTLIDLSDKLIDKNKIDDEIADEQQRELWDNIWGDGYEDADCRKLDEYFDAYTKEIFDMDTAMRLRYRDLCKAELRKFKGDESKEVTDEILKLMKLLKIDDFKENKQSETEKFIDRWAWRIENTEPAECEDLEKYKDYAGNQKMWKDILRTVRNAVAGSRDYPDLTKGDNVGW